MDIKSVENKDMRYQMTISMPFKGEKTQVGPRTWQMFKLFSPPGFTLLRYKYLYTHFVCLLIRICAPQGAAMLVRSLFCFSSPLMNVF